MVNNYPVQAIDLPVRDDRSVEAEDARKAADTEAEARSAEDTRVADRRKEDLGKEEVGKNIDETV